MSCLCCASCCWILKSAILMASYLLRCRLRGPPPPPALDTAGEEEEINWAFDEPFWPPVLSRSIYLLQDRERLLVPPDQLPEVPGDPRRVVALRLQNVGRHVNQVDPWTAAGQTGLEPGGGIVPLPTQSQWCPPNWRLFISTSEWPSVCYSYLSFIH